MMGTVRIRADPPGPSLSQRGILIPKFINECCSCGLMPLRLTFMLTTNAWQPRGGRCALAATHSVPACLGCLMPHCHSCSEGALRQGPIVWQKLTEGWGQGGVCV